jgi:hypothetical protein
MELNDMRPRSPCWHRTHLSAIITSLFASLLLLFGGDVFGRFHAGLSSDAAISRSDAGNATAGTRGETRFLVSSEQSSRPKLRPIAGGDGCLAPDIQTLWICRHGHDTPRVSADRPLAHAPLPYWSRAPPSIQQTA